MVKALVFTGAGLHGATSATEPPALADAGAESAPPEADVEDTSAGAGDASVALAANVRACKSIPTVWHAPFLGSMVGRALRERREEWALA